MIVINRYMRKLAAQYAPGSTFSTEKGKYVTGRRDFAAWASGNPRHLNLQLFHAGGSQWVLRRMEDRLALAVVPRLLLLKEPFAPRAASMVLNLPLPASNHILGTLARSGILSSMDEGFRVRRWVGR